MIKGIGLLAIAALAGCRDAVTPAGEPSDAHGTAIPLTPYFRDLRTVSAVVGQDTLTLLFDTGGGATLITPAVAARLGCRPYGRDVGHRMSGEPVEFQRCDSLSFSLSGWQRQLKPVGVFDINALLPAELPRLDGVLALDAFKGEVVTLDWPSGRVIVHTPSSGDAALAAHGIPVRGATGENGRTLTLFARVSARRGLLWFLLDSGNLRGTLVDRRVVEDSLLVPGTDSLVELQIGGRPPIRVPLQRSGLTIDGVFGTDLLQRGAVALDLRPWQ